MSGTLSIPSETRDEHNKVNERMLKSDVPSEARMWCPFCLTNPKKYRGRFYGKYRDVKKHVKKVHGQCVQIKCKRCPWICYDALDCFLEHAKNAHKIVFNGKATKFFLKDDFFEWVGSENEPTEKHTPIYEEGRKKRKKAISKGTKQRFRLTAETANMLND